MMSAAMGVAGGLISAVAANYVLPHLLKVGARRNLAVRCAASRSVCLTYDDGPSALTPYVLARLASADVKATFFVTAENATRHPEMLERIVAGGHELGCHSRDHVHAWRVWPWQAHVDATNGLATLRRRTSDVSLYRPAYGKITATTWWALRRSGAQLAWWTVDSGDCLPVPDAGRAEREVAAAGGGVVLLHDASRDDLRNRFVLDTTDAIVTLARSSGLTVRRFGDVVRGDLTAPDAE